MSIILIFLDINAWRESRKEIFGKFRGITTNNKDPSNLARIRALVPAIFGNQYTSRAFQSIPYAGDGDGVGFYFIPPIGSNV